MDISKVYCPSCGQSRQADSGDTYSFKICDTCITFRDKSHNHSEIDVQNEIKRNIDKTIRHSVR